MRKVFTNEKQRRNTWSILDHCSACRGPAVPKFLPIRNEKPSSTSEIRASEIGTTYADFYFVNQNKKILVVEDNDEERELLVKILNHFGYDVIEANSGTAAISQTSKGHPDIILMDMYLPEMNGDKVIVCLKENPATRDIPVIITGGLLVQVQNRTPFADAAEILQKPFRFTTLREILDRHLATGESKEELLQFTNR